MEQQRYCTNCLKFRPEAGGAFYIRKIGRRIWKKWYCVQCRVNRAAALAEKSRQTTTPEAPKQPHRQQANKQ